MKKTRVYHASKNICSRRNENLHVFTGFHSSKFNRFNWWLNGVSRSYHCAGLQSFFVCKHFTKKKSKIANIFIYIFCYCTTCSSLSAMIAFSWPDCSLEKFIALRMCIKREIEDKAKKFAILQVSTTIYFSALSNNFKIYLQLNRNIQRWKQYLHHFWLLIYIILIHLLKEIKIELKISSRIYYYTHNISTCRFAI